MSRSRPKMIPATNVKFETAELRKLQLRMEKLFSVFEESLEFEGTKTFNTFTPAIDLCETADAVCVTIELPGIDPGEIQLAVTAKDISISGEKSHSANTQQAISHLCCERQYGKFERHVNLRWAININETTAELKDGTLYICMPKLADRRGKSVKIPIKVKD